MAGLQLGISFRLLADVSSSYSRHSQVQDSLAKKGRQLLRGKTPNAEVQKIKSARSGADSPASRAASPAVAFEAGASGAAADGSSQGAPAEQGSPKTPKGTGGPAGRGALHTSRTRGEAWRASAHVSFTPESILMGSEKVPEKNPKAAEATKAEGAPSASPSHLLRLQSNLRMQQMHEELLEGSLTGGSAVRDALSRMAASEAVS